MINMTSFADELVKIKQAQGALMNLAGKGLTTAAQHWKPLSLIGAGAAGMHFGKKELDKYLLGRQVYERMQQAGG